MTITGRSVELVDSFAVDERARKPMVVPLVEGTRCGPNSMDDDSQARLDHPERLCDAIVELIDELEDDEILDRERASELRSEIYRSINIPDE